MSAIRSRAVRAPHYARTARRPSTPTRLALCAASLALLAGAPAVALAQADADLPLTAITLYRSGVGSFQRQGLVDGHAQVQLRFDTDQVNDILKSMVLLDLGGGRIDAVSYASREPLERRLASFAIDMSSNPSIAGLLAQIRGATVRTSSVDGDATGTVIGVETRQAAAADRGVISKPYLNLLTGTGIRSIDIGTLRTFEILDRDLQAELERALSAIAEQRSENVKTVDLTFDGAGARRVYVAYVHEMPVWKTSYRLILPEEVGQDGRPAAGGKPTLQGWAIVENTTDEDWNGVRLSLVAGQPVGFQMDLYEPLYLSRPVVPVPVIANVAPTVYERGTGGASPVAQPTPEAMLRVAPSAPGRGRSEVSDSAAGFASPLGADDMTAYAAAAQARAGEIGEVFQYTIDTPVSLDRQRSAMIPIITSPLDGRRVSIYNRATARNHPMRGVELRNTSSLQLLPGPIAVYDGSAYAGDAQIGHIVPGDRRLLSYAVDLNVHVQSTDESDRMVRRIRIVGGLIEQTVQNVASTTYTIENKDRASARTVIVEHPRLGGHSLTEPSEAAETTENLYRFEVAIEAGRTRTLKITQEQTTAQRLTLLSWNLGTMLEHQRQGRVSAAVVEAFRGAAARQQTINDRNAEIARLEAERNEIGRDQGRIRENMGRLDRTNELYIRYVQTMTQQETRLEQINTEVTTLRQRVAEAQADLENYLRNLNVE